MVAKLPIVIFGFSGYAPFSVHIPGVLLLSLGYRA